MTDQTSGGDARPPAAEQLSDDDRRGRRHWLRTPLAAGIGVALVVLIAGLGYVATRAESWSAHRNIVVVPATTELAQAASLYDSLSRGQVVATAAELYGQSRWHRDHPEVTVVSGNLPPSAVIQVTVSGADPAVVQETLTAVVANATPEVNTLLRPYHAVVLETDPPVAHETGLGRGGLGMVVVLAALLAGATAAGATARLSARAGQAAAAHSDVVA